MIDEAKLTMIVETFASYNVEIRTQGMTIIAINGEPTHFEAQTFMQDQLIEMICKVLANQIIKETWLREHPEN